MISPIQNQKDFPIRKILIVDDEKSLRMVLTKALERTGFFCSQACDAKTALESIAREKFDLVISDIAMPGMDGVELLKKIKIDHPEIDVVIMTGYKSDYSYVDIMDAGASDYMTKPFNLNSTLARIKRIAREKKNIIDLKKTNQELCVTIDRANILTREAKEASRAKTFFLASMSHEIRTPLNGIVGYTDMLLDTPLDEEQKSFLKHTRYSCETLLSVVNDILDFSKVEAGKLTLEKIAFDPEVLCFDTIDAIRSKVDESKVELLCSVADSVPAQLIGDPHRFRQVLLNLLSNAVKFTHKGHIKLSIDAKKIAREKFEIIISVQDSGIGIPKKDLKKIFKPFIQSEDDITNRYGGTGLGLAIIKNIAGKMQGDVWVESTENKGSVFYFTSCFKAGENKKTQRVRPVRLNGKKVLISTTSEETCKILVHELSLANIETSHVDFNDLESYLKKHGDNDFDVVIFDFGKFVKIDSRDLTRKLQNILPVNCKYDSIACSIPSPGIADIFCKAGFKAFLPKPISRKKLYDMVSYVIGMKKENFTPVTAPKEIITAHILSENKKASASILLVEDNLVNQKMTNLMLSKAGYLIDIASDGKEAVDKYISSPEAYDLIFMDINMPKMNGFEATKLIRSFERNNKSIQEIPILALTANVLDDFKEKCTQAGMNEFLTKPIKRELVFQAIQQWTK